MFLTGTPDNFVYGINAVNGDVLWSYKMEAADWHHQLYMKLMANNMYHISQVEFLESLNQKDLQFILFQLNEKISNLKYRYNE